MLTINTSGPWLWVTGRGSVQPQWSEVTRVRFPQSSEEWLGRGGVCCHFAAVNLISEQRALSETWYNEGGPPASLLWWSAVLRESREKEADPRKFWMEINGAVSTANSQIDSLICEACKTLSTFQFEWKTEILAVNLVSNWWLLSIHRKGLDKN